MDDHAQSSRRLKVSLVVRDETDDPSIVDIVRVAIEDGLRASSVGAASPQTEPTSGEPERHAPINEKLEDQAREQIEEALAKVMEQFHAAGKEPKFAPTVWVEKLSKVWAVIHKAKAAGVQLRVLPAEGEAAPAEGS